MKIHGSTVALLGTLLGCATPEPTPGPSSSTTVSTAETSAAPAQLVVPVTDDDAGFPNETLIQNEPFTGDLDGMIERRVIRAAVVLSLTQYFFDGATQRGITYEALRAFEDALNERLGTGHLKVHVAIFPVARDELLPALVSGRADIAAANLTITPERRKLVDFSTPAATGVSEIVVTGPAAPELRELHDLSGQQMHVRASSSYYESLKSLNDELRALGREEAKLVLVDEHLEDEDLLQMVDAGLIGIIVVDDHKASFWKQIFRHIELHPELALRTGGEIAWAFRKDSPELAREVNAFIRKNRKGTLLGNVLFKRYLRSTKWLSNALSAGGKERFDETIQLFREYGDRYGFDPLMLAALGYQESRLDQSVRSAAGAIGVMQLLPSTAADKNVGIPNIELLENNVHAGTKYLRFLRERYFEDAPLSKIDKTLFTFAAYNAGPARVRGLRQKARAAGLDENVWFDNVEVIAAREIGRETVQYVSNIYKYYIAYREARRQWEQKARAAR